MTLKVFNNENRHHHCLKGFNTEKGLQNFLMNSVFNTEKGLHHFLTTLKIFDIEKELHHFLETLKGFNFEK